MKSAFERRKNPAPTPGIRVISHPRCPPGQRSVYVPLGDSRRETYRLSTFHRFPDRNVDSWSLARSGFYFTGYKDRIKCFNCGVAVENLSRDDEVHSSDWHRQECEYAHGDGAGNVPIGQRRFASPNPSITCEEELNSAMSRSARILPATYRRPPIFQHAAGTNCAMSSDIFPCRNPINPHMRSVETRLQAYSDRAIYWPAHRINATPRDIADAGFHYLGQRDRARCRHCNGESQNRQRDNDPLMELAEWCPMCELVFKQEELELVQRIVSQFLDQRIPMLHNLFQNGHNALASLERQSSFESTAASSFRPTTAAYSRPTAVSFSRPTAGAASSSRLTAATSSRRTAVPSSRRTTAASSTSTAAVFSRPTAASFPSDTAASYWIRMRELPHNCLQLLFCELGDTDRYARYSFPVMAACNASSSGQHVLAPMGDVFEES